MGPPVGRKSCEWRILERVPETENEREYVQRACLMDGRVRDFSQFVARVDKHKWDMVAAVIPPVKFGTLILTGVVAPQVAKQVGRSALGRLAKQTRIDEFVEAALPTSDGLRRISDGLRYFANAHQNGELRSKLSEAQDDFDDLLQKFSRGSKYYNRVLEDEIVAYYQTKYGIRIRR